MKVNPKSVKRNVTLMTDPAPTHLSAVNHGAIQAPWKTLKGHEMAKGVKSQATKDGVIKFLTLSKAEFKTEKAAQQYLTSKNWDPSSYTIEDDDDVWVARSTEEYPEGSLSKPRSVATKDHGVFMHVSELIEKDDTEEEDEDDDSGNVAKADPGITTTPIVNDDVDGESDQSVTERDIPGAGAVGKPGSTDATGQGKTTTDNLVPNPTSGGDTAKKTIKVKPRPVVKAKMPVEVVPDKAGNDADGESGQTVTVQDIPHDNAAGENRKKRAEAKTVTIEGEETIQNAKKDGDEPALIVRYGGELAKKYDWWSAYSSDDETLLEVIEDGMAWDNLPPGAGEVLDAFKTAAGNILGSQEITNKGTALAKLGGEAARILNALYELFKSSSVELGNEPAQKWVGGFKDSIIKMMNDKNEAPAPVPVQTTKAAEPSTTDIIAAVKAAVAEELAPVKKELTDTVNAVKSDLETLKGDLGNVAKEVDNALSETPTKKSMADAMDDLVDEEFQQAQKSNETDERVQRAKATMGWRRR